MSCENGQLMLSPGKLRVARSPASDVALPPDAWLVAENASSLSGLAADVVCLSPPAAWPVAENPSSLPWPVAADCDAHEVGQSKSFDLHTLILNKITPI